jgi:uncharacterized protein (DUF736 family)
MELIKELDDLEKEFIKVFKGQVIHNFYNLEKYKEISLLIRQEKPPMKNNFKEDKNMETKEKVKIKGRKGKLEKVKDKDIWKLKIFLMPFVIEAVVIKKEDRVDEKQPDFLILKDDVMIGALWIKTSSKGKSYLSGYIDYILNDDKRLFINIFRSEDGKNLVYVNEPEATYINEEGLPDVDDGIPF